MIIGIEGIAKILVRIFYLESFSSCQRSFFLGALAEGLASLRAAESFRTVGKERKAQRLFDHAMSLAPHHPDVLAQYGLFAEESKKDVVNADFYYTRALLYRPDHALALR